MTNGDTGASMVAGGNLVMDWISHKDGTADVWVVGTVVAGYGPTDAPGMGLWVLNGQLHDKVGADGWSTIAHLFRGRAVDLCTALARP